MYSPKDMIYGNIRIIENEFVKERQKSEVVIRLILQNGKKR